jgi:hypothetical protein
MATSVTPWWKALKIRQEILNASGQIDDVQMSLFRAAYGRSSDKPLYADAGYYGEITHPTERLTDLLTEIAVRVGGGEDYLKARSVTRLDQGMGGGKSHACIGAFHLAAHPEALLGTELGRQVGSRAKAKTGKDLPLDLNAPHVVVLPCDNMTPGAPVQELDGPAVSLYERFLWRLFSKDYSLYERYRPFWSDKSKIGEALKAVNRPVLILIDEILDYVGNGLDGANLPDLVAQDIAFLRALLDVVNDVPNVALLVVMIASDSDKTALSAAGAARRDDLNALLERNGTPATVTEAGDFADILRRRLFDAEPASELITATAALYRPILEDRSWTRSVWDAVGDGDRLRRWNDDVAVCYPFHPMLMTMAMEEWSKVTGFQRVRSTIRIFAATVYAQQQRGKAGEWVPVLIGPGDLPLSDSSVREALLGSGLVEDERTIANYRSLAEIEVVDNDDSTGTARRQDLERPALTWTPVNPRAAERAATYVFLASIVGTLRPGRGRGASAPEVKAASSVPDLSYTVTDADTVVEDLVNPERGMSAVETIPGQGNNKPARYFLSTRLTYQMLVSNIRRTITTGERDSAIAEFVERLASSGPFREHRFIKAELERMPADVLATAGLDTAYTSRLIVLDPAQYTVRNGDEKDTRAALAVAMGLNRDAHQLPVQWASSAVFALVGAQGRARIRGVAVEYLARQKALSAPEIQNDSELKANGTKELAKAKEQLEKTIKRAFQHVVYLAQPDPQGERYLDEITFDDEHSSALDGTIVWKALAERDKVFDSGAFDAKALVHNLRDTDYGKSLSDLRAAFYSAPRLPLLYAGDRDLQHAIHDAVNAGLIDVVDGAGMVVAVTAASQINLSSADLRLVKPQSALCPRCKRAAHDGACASDAIAGPEDLGGDGVGRSSVAIASAGSSPPALDTQVKHERQVAFSFTRNLLADPKDADAFATLFKSLYTTLDEQQITYMQGTLQIVLDTAAAEELQRCLNELNIVATVKTL